MQRCRDGSDILLRCLCSNLRPNAYSSPRSGGTASISNGVAPLWIRSKSALAFVSWYAAAQEAKCYSPAG